MTVDQDTHEQVRDRLVAYARRVVDEGERATIETHLISCQECRRAAITALESASLLVDEPLSMPGTVWDAIVERAARRTGPRATPGVPTPAPRRAGTG